KYATKAVRAKMGPGLTAASRGDWCDRHELKNRAPHNRYDRFRWKRRAALRGSARFQGPSAKQLPREKVEGATKCFCLFLFTLYFDFVWNLELGFWHLSPWARRCCASARPQPRGMEMSEKRPSRALAAFPITGADALEEGAFFGGEAFHPFDADP